MPTTKDEAIRIMEITNEYLPHDVAKEYTERLHREVGVDSTNTSLKISLEMFQALYNKEERKKFVAKILILRVLLVVVVTIHFLVLFANFLAIFILPFYAPWYLSIPLIALIANFTFTPSICPLTQLEDKIRHKLGIPKIKYFVGYYIVWPLRKLIREKYGADKKSVDATCD